MRIKIKCFLRYRAACFNIADTITVDYRSMTGGGDSRARTDDPLLAKQVLSQLSYTPMLDILSQN